MPRESWFSRLLRHFHEHPQGRLHEFLFWTVLGLVIGAASWFAWSAGALSTPLALVGAIIAICFILWALLPQRKPKAKPKALPGKRGKIAEQVRASKKERRKGPGPPIT